MFDRREFGLGIASAAFGGLALSGCSGLNVSDLVQRIPSNRTGVMRRFQGYGLLESDRHAERLFDLPRGFCYDVISWRGEYEGASQHLTGGGDIPDRADGMGAFPIDDRRMALVRNHELNPSHIATGAFPSGGAGATYDTTNGHPLPGGTTTIVYDYVEHRVEGQYLTLQGTIRNCAGGVTPHGSWLTCEEDTSNAERGLSKDHGWVFEVPAAARAPIDPRPIKDMGRFKHEAAAVDPTTGIVYLTEDQIDGLFYRFLPRDRRDYLQGGTLQALKLGNGAVGLDSRNWSGSRLPVGTALPVQWVTLENVKSPGVDDLRKRGRNENGATPFAGGEGIHSGRDADGRSEFFFCCTSGGAIRSGQIMRYRPPPAEQPNGEGERPGTLEIFLETNDPFAYNFGDNLTIAPNGHLLVCEDAYFGPHPLAFYRDLGKKLGRRPGCYLRGVTPDGAVYDIAFLHGNTELAGVCLSPDARTVFVNVHQPTKTLAIRGPWNWLDHGIGLCV